MYKLSPGNHVRVEMGLMFPRAQNGRYVSQETSSPPISLYELLLS